MSYSAPQPAISVRNLSKSYFVYDQPSDRLRQMLSNAIRAPISLKRKQHYTIIQALKPISFDLEHGKTIAIIGLNGSGKSTLLQLICGTLDASTGTVHRSGRIAALLELGAGFNPMLTGRENVVFAGLLLGMTRAEIDNKFDRITAFADIGEFIDYPVNTYSTGMFVRLAFAVAIHSEPEILIVDEALAVGDFMFQQKCNRFLKENMGDTTKLLVTHDLSAVTNLADSVLVLNNGELVFSGDPQTAIEQYQIFARADNSTSPALTPLPLGDETEIEELHEAIAIDWRPISIDKLSGSLKARFSKFEVSVDGNAWSDLCKTGSLVRVNFAIESPRPLEHVTFGYQIQDRFGNVIFGNNSIGSGLGDYETSAGSSAFSLEFMWPLVAADEYGITLGIGQGDHEIHHSIICWAHNISVLKSAPNEELHGIFNVPIGRLERVE